MSDRQQTGLSTGVGSVLDDGDERMVLGCLLEHPETGQAALGPLLDPALFASPSCKTIFGAMSLLFGSRAPVNFVTVTSKLREMGELDAVGGPYELSRLSTEFPCGPTTAQYHLGRMRDAAAVRLALQTGEWLSDRAKLWSLESNEIISELHERLDKIQAIRDAGQAAAVTVGSLVAANPDDGQELLRTRFLCRGGGMLLVGPTGVGKSSLSFQAAVSWALGKPCFGIAPARALRSLIIQAENDGGDMAEMRDGVFAGMELTEGERQQAGEMIHVFHEDARSGEDFFHSTVEPLLRLHRPDLLWIDPALSYIGGESNSQEDVGRFLRNWLNPLLRKYQCGGIVVHHTNKPPSGKEKAEWSGTDLAYLGSGSAEWANWARAVVAIRSLGENGIFNLCLGKRGGRVGWIDETGAKIYSTLIGHAKEPGRIYWRNADENELLGGGNGAAKKFVFAHITEHIPADGIRTAALQRLVCSETGMSRSGFYTLLNEAEAAGAIYKDKLSQQWEVQQVQNHSK